MKTAWNFQPLPTQLTEALGWTLLHALWQGVAIAMLLALALIFLRKNSARVRYVVSVSALVALCCLCLGTFWTIYRAEPKPADATINTATAYTLPETAADYVFVGTVAASSPQTLEEYLQTYQHYFEQQLPLLVTLWLLGVGVLMLRLLGGIAYLQRIRHYKTFAAATHWQNQTQALAERIGIRKTVNLLESALVQVPMTIGFLKPVILLPIGALAGLSASQVEMILAHELAHIRRHDYLVNLLQSVVEIVLFFHPAMWWIAARIREEREHCCDDIALQITQDPLTFARTLAAVEELRLGVPALAFSGTRGSLLTRVKRVMQQPRTQATFTEGFWAACLLVFFLGVAAWGAQAGINDMDQLQTQEVYIDALKNKENDLMPTAQTLPWLPGDTIRFGQNFMIVVDKNGQVQAFKDGQPIPQEAYEQYADEFQIDEQQVRIRPNNPEQAINIRLDPKKQNIERRLAAVRQVNRDSLRGSKTIMMRGQVGETTWQRDGLFIKLDKDGNILELQDGGQTIEPKDYARYESQIDEVKNSVRFFNYEDAGNFNFQFEESVEWAERQAEWAERQAEWAERQAEWAEKFAENAQRWAENLVFSEIPEIPDATMAFVFRSKMDTKTKHKLLISEMRKDGLLKEGEDSYSNGSEIIIKDGKVKKLFGKKIPTDLEPKYRKIWAE